jgi:hypothetical protein
MTDFLLQQQGRNMIKTASMARSLRTDAARIGKMFQSSNTNGKQIIEGQKKKQPMSMDDIAAQKKQQEFERDQQKFTKEQEGLAIERQKFEQEQMLAKHKLEVERMLAKAQPAPTIVAPQGTPPETHKALASWASRLNKDLKRLTSR